MSDSPDLSNRTLFGIQNDAVRYTWAAYNLFILMSSLIGDSIIIIASIKYNAIKLHKIIVVIIRHIAVCDLTVSLVTVFPRSVSLLANDWVFGNTLKYFAAYGIYYFNAVSLLLICAMTTSKLIIMKYPFEARFLSEQTGQLICASLWVVSLCIILIPVIIDRHDIIFDHRTYDCRIRFSADIYRWLKPVVIGLFTLLPNILVIVTTIHLLIIAQGFARRGKESLKWQGVITTILVAAVYCISILPYTIYSFIGYSRAAFADDPHSFFRTHYNRIVKSFIFLNIISNFYIYSMTVASFREFLLSRMQLLKISKPSIKSSTVIVRRYNSISEPVSEL